MDFHDWISEKYVEWRGDSRRTVTEFATFLKISQSTVSAWINRTRGRPVSKVIIDKLIKVYGDEARGILLIKESSAVEFEYQLSPDELEHQVREIKSYLDSIPGLKRVEWRKDKGN